nr:hypothetical protein ICEMyc226_00317 [Mycolicibacterium sp.]
MGVQGMDTSKARTRAYAGHNVGREQVGRRMRAAGIAGSAGANGYAPSNPTQPLRCTRSGQAELHRDGTQ